MLQETKVASVKEAFSTYRSAVVWNSRTCFPVLRRVPLNFNYLTICVWKIETIHLSQLTTCGAFSLVRNNIKLSLCSRTLVPEEQQSVPQQQESQILKVCAEHTNIGFKSCITTLVYSRNHRIHINADLTPARKSYVLKCPEHKTEVNMKVWNSPCFQTSTRNTTLNFDPTEH